MREQKQGDLLQPRMDHGQVAPGGCKAMAALEAYLRDGGLDKPLLPMGKLRAYRKDNGR